MEQKTSERFIILKRSVMLDKQLTPTDMKVYARICMFEEFFESSESTAEMIGVKADTVKKSKAKLEKLGYIRCVRNTGRGKVYVPLYDDYQTSTDMPDRRAQTCTSDRHVYTPIVKKENRILDTKVSKAQSHDDEQKEYGNSEINAIFQAWTDAGLPAITSRVQSSRRTIWNMLRNKDIGADRLRQGIELAGEAYGEPYAPTVLNFEDLNRKLTALEAWKQKQTVLTEQPKRQPSASSYSPTYSGEIAYERRPYDDRPSILDQEKVTEVFSDDFYEEMRQKVHGKRKENNNE